MLKLALAAVSAEFCNFNARTEKSGPDTVPAADLEFQIAQHADKLDELSDTLKSHLFDTAGPKDLADGMALAHPDWNYPLGIDGEMTGAALNIETGIGKGMDFADVKVSKLRITPMEGGSVILGIRCQCKPDEKQAGKLYMLQGQKVTISITPAKEQDLLDGDDAPAEKPKRGARVPKNQDGATVQ